MSNFLLFSPLILMTLFTGFSGLLIFRNRKKEQHKPRIILPESSEFKLK